MYYRLLADIVAGLHVAWVAFVVFGLVFVLIGRALGWRWVGNRWFRSIHLAMISIVIVRSLIWPECPLSTWERDLRVMAGQVDDKGEITFEGSAVGKVLHDLIHPDFNRWVFPVVYILFGMLVVAAFWLAPVDWRRAPPPLAAGEPA